MKKSKKLKKLNKKTLAALLLSMLGAPLFATWFVVTSGPPNWVDMSVVGNDEVLAKQIMVSYTATGGHEENRPGIGADYEVVSQPEGFVWDVNNVGDPNVFTFEYKPTVVGVTYARVKVSIVKPYVAGETHFTLAFNAREAIFPLPGWWYRLLKR